MVRNIDIMLIQKGLADIAVNEPRLNSGQFHQIAVNYSFNAVVPKVLFGCWDRFKCWWGQEQGQEEPSPLR